MKIKRWDVSVLGKKEVSTIKNTDFYTADTSASLVVDLMDVGINPTYATVVLSNKNKGITVGEKVDLEERTFSLPLNKDVMSVQGEWEMQVVFNDRKDYTTTVIPFIINGSLIDRKEFAHEI